MRIISLDLESNGLGGKAFAGAAALYDHDGTEVEVWQARCPIDGPVDPWVAENIIPGLADMPENCTGYWRMCVSWDDWHYQHRADDLYVLGHVVWPVESTFLRDIYAGDLFAGPYPLLDVAPLLLAAGHDPTSVDKYLEAQELPKPPGSPHHPLYDCRATATAFRHLMAGAQRARMGIPAVGA